MTTSVAEDAGPTITALRGQEAKWILEQWVWSAKPAPDPMYVKRLLEYVTELERQQ